MRDDPRARLHPVQFWDQRRILSGQQVNGHYVNSRQIDFENVLALEGRQRVNVFQSSLFARCPDEVRTDFVADGSTKYRTGCASRGDVSGIPAASVL